MSPRLITCDICEEPINNVDDAMVFWDRSGAAHRSKQPRNMVVAHKSMHGKGCDDDTRPCSMELSSALSPTGFDRFLDFLEQPDIDAKSIVRVLHKLYFDAVDPNEFARLSPPASSLDRRETVEATRQRASAEQRLAADLDHSGTCPLCGCKP